MSSPSEIAQKNGKRGGRPLGRKNTSTIEKEKAMAAYRERVLANADRLLDIQLAAAKGATYLFKIEKELIVGKRGGKRWVPKKPELVEDIEEIRAYLEGAFDQPVGDQESTYYFITTKDPDTGAIRDMLDRAAGRPVQSMDLNMKTTAEKIATFNPKQRVKIAKGIIAADREGTL